MSRKVTICLSLVILLNFAGCAGIPLFSILPEPGPEGDSYLIIPIHLKRDVSGEPFGKYKLRIINTSNPRIVRRPIINTQYDYIFASKLAAGTYKIVEQAFVYNKSGKIGRVSNPDITFDLKPNCITILHKQCICRLFINPDDNEETMNYSWGSLTQDKAKQILKRLSEEPSFKMWRLSERTRKDQAVRQALLELGLKDYL